MKFFFTIACLFVIHTSSAQTLQQTIEKAYTRFEQDGQLQYGMSSLTVLNAETGELIFSKNGNVGLASASTLKMVTAATALSTFGKDFTWETTLGYSGALSKGVLIGNLILRGGGDPTLGSSRYTETSKHVLLKKWVYAIRQAGIKQVHGRILVDDHLFGTQTLPDGWIWQDMGNYFGAGSGAVSWNENQFELILQPAVKVGDPVKIVRSEPRMPNLKIINEVTTGVPSSGDQVYAYSAPYSDVIYLRGTYAIDLKKIISISMPDPAFEVAFRLQDTLKQLGIQIDQPASTTRRLAIDGLILRAPAPRQAQGTEIILKILSTHQSPPLAKVIEAFNQKSINLYGEVLLKTFAWKQGKSCTTHEGVKIVKTWWANKLGIDINEMNIMDGSGLSPATRITTQSMGRILCSARKEIWFDDFYKSVPSNNNMRMKSGSIKGVSAYAGYQTTSNGIPLAFSFIVNNYNGSTATIKQKMFSVLNVLKQ